MSSETMDVPEFPDGLHWFNTQRPLRFRQELRGRVVILDFWTYCCINCMHVLPDLEYLEEKYAGAPLAIIGVHSNKYTNEAQPENVREAVLRYGISHPVVVDEGHAIWNACGITAWPTLLIIDADGHAIGALPGEGHREQLDQIIAALLQRGQARGILAHDPLPLCREQDPPTPSGLSFPGKVLADAAGGRLFIADSGHHRVLVTDWEGEIRQIYGDGQPGFRDGPAAACRLHAPQGLALIDDMLYIADTENHVLRRAEMATGQLATVLGDGELGEDRRGGQRGTAQALNSPWDLAFLEGTLYIAMAGLHQIWAYHPDTQLGEAVIGTGRENITDNAARKAALAQPSGLAAAEGKLYFADSETSAIRVYDPSSGQIHTLVGAGLFIFGDVDGPAGCALLQHPLGVTATDDTLYVADTYNHKIRKIDLRAGTVSTLAGVGHPGHDVDGQLALYEPGGLSLAGEDLFIADTNHHRIVRYRPRTGEWWEVVPKMGGQPMSRAA